MQSPLLFSIKPMPPISAARLYNVSSRYGLVAGFFVLEIKTKVLHVREHLIPFLERLDVNGAEVLMALSSQISDQMAANKAATSANHSFSCAHIYLSE